MELEEYGLDFNGLVRHLVSGKMPDGSIARKSACYCRWSKEEISTWYFYKD